jgi:hypothetical protein
MGIPIYRKKRTGICMGWLLLLAWGLLPVLLTFGAIDALVPLLIIIILIAAAATLNRGWNALNIFGIGTLAGVAGAMGTKGSMRGKSPFTGGKKYGRGYEKMIKGALKTGQGAAGLAALRNINANRLSPAAAKAALVTSTVDHMLGKSPKLPASTGKATMFLAWAAGGNVNKYAKTTNKLSNPALTPGDRDKLIREKEGLERAIYGKAIKTGADRPHTNVAELSTEGVSPIIAAAAETAMALKKQGFEIGPKYLGRIVENESAAGGAEWAARQKAFMDAVNATKGAAFTALPAADQRAEVEKLADLHLYGAKPSPDATKEIGRITTEVAAAYAKAPVPSEFRKWTNALGFPPEEEAGTKWKSAKEAVGFTGYLASSAATVGLLPGLAIVHRQFNKWNYGR